MIPLLVVGIIVLIAGFYIRKTSPEGPRDSKARMSNIVGIIKAIGAAFRCLYK